MVRDTIVALSTPAGRSGVAVIRVSGGQALEGLAMLTSAGGLVPANRRACLRRLVDPSNGETIDQALVLAFAGPASFTGDDLVEYHCHGGKAVIDHLTNTLLGLPGHRLAQPGEFTRRAFEHGKLDLTEVEGLADLIDAETAAQHRQALRQLDGALGRLYEGWRHRLIRCLAHIEADLDFPDEDLPEGVAEAVGPELAAVASEIEEHLADARRGERVRSGFSIAVLGRPNAGKSSLVNALANRDAAIVSATAGTTRDIIEVHLDLGGYSVIVADTAGLRGSGDEVEQEGVRRARHRAENADLRLVILDQADVAGMETRIDEKVGENRRCRLPSDIADLVNEDTLVVINKVDRGRDHAKKEIVFPGSGRPVHLSVKTGYGMSGLLDRLVEMIGKRWGGSENPPLTRARHREALRDCVESLDRGRSASLPELAAEDVRLAVRSLGRITGRVDVEDILDVIFRDFCIGK